MCIHEKWSGCKAVDKKDNWGGGGGGGGGGEGGGRGGRGGLVMKLYQACI